MRRMLPLLLAALLGAASATPTAPEAHWTDERHALLTWQQAAPEELLCIGKIAHGNYILIGCGPFAAGPQELRLPPFPSGNDAEVWPHVGDVYIVGEARSAPLEPVPELRVVRLPLVRR